MFGSGVNGRDVVRLADHAGELEKVRRCDDDERIDRAFNAVCRHIWGYTLDDFDDDSLSAKDHAFLDGLTGKRACKFAIESGYDLIDPRSGEVVTEWWGFTWMILAEKRGLLTPEARAAAWQRYEAKLMAETNVIGVIRAWG